MTSHTVTPRTNVFRRPPEPEVRRLLEESGLPTADLTPEHMEHFFACGPAHAPQGVVGVELYGPEALLRSLAVAQSARCKGYGKALVAEAERYARSRGVRRMHLLTTTAERFFERLGYVRLAREAAPDPIRGTREFAALCPASSAFMVKDLPASPRRGGASPRSRGSPRPARG